MPNEALQIVGERDVFLMDKGDVPARMLMEGNAVQGHVPHIVKDEVHRSGVALVFFAELVAEAETARIEVDVEVGIFPATCLLHDVMDEEVIILDDHGLSCNVADRDCK